MKRTINVSAGTNDSSGFYVYFIYENSNIVERFDLNQLYQWFQSQPDILTTKGKIYKISDPAGAFIDETVYNQIIKDKNSVIFLYEKGRIEHGIVYTGIPISIDRLNDIENLRNELKRILPGPMSFNYGVNLLS
jgi:hypothetical protein